MFERADVHRSPAGAAWLPLFLLVVVGLVRRGNVSTPLFSPEYVTLSGIRCHDSGWATLVIWQQGISGSRRRDSLLSLVLSETPRPTGLPEPGPGSLDKPSHLCLLLPTGAGK